jgi:hypothetical protein
VSLIVGYATSDIGFLVADTLITFPIEKYDPRKPAIERFHVLKIHILTPDIAVGFAGEVGAALRIIRRLQTELADDSGLNVSQKLFDLRRQSGANCEFLTLVLHADGKKLSRITSTEIHEATRAYIGDPVEYKNLTNLIGDYEGPQHRSIQNADGKFETIVVTADEKKFEQISSAMEKLTYLKTSETVGAICGCITRVVDARISTKLEYMQAVEYGTSSEEGRTGFSLLASNRGIRGIGIYYYG